MNENLTVKEVYDYLGNLIENGFGDNQLECSVDMSIDGNEETYVHRVFGRSPYCVRVYYSMNEDKDIVQILFEKGEDNNDSLNIGRENG